MIDTDKLHGFITNYENDDLIRVNPEMFDIDSKSHCSIAFGNGDHQHKTQNNKHTKFE